MSSLNKKLTRGVTEIVNGVLEEVSKRYGLDAEDVKASVGLIIVKEKEEKKKNIVLPFTGRIDEEKCQAIKINYGLYTQCENNFFKGSFCKNCYKQSEKNSDGKPNYGTIDERMDKNFTDKNGKKPIKYSKIMEKLKITRAMAEKEASQLGVLIPQEEFEIEKTKRGRPKKSTSTTDTSDEESIAEPKKRGRPPKEKKVIENGNMGDDVIQNLIEMANQKESEPKKLESPAPIIQEKVEAKPQSNYQEKIKAEDNDSHHEDDDSDDEEEETVVVAFTHKGKKYLKAVDNTIYDIDSHEEIGIWDEDKQEIVESED